MNFRPWLLVAVFLLGACGAAHGQEATVTPVPEAAVVPSPAEAPAPVADELMQKLKQVGEEMEKDAAAAVPEARASESRLAGTGGGAPEPAGRADTPGFVRNALRALGSLLLVLALIVGLTYLLKRYGRKSALFSGAALGKVLGKIHLAPRVSIHFVETGGKVLVLGVNSSTVSTLATFEALEFNAVLEAAAREAEPKGEAVPRRDENFLAELRSVMQDMEGKPNPRQTGGFSASGDARELAALRGEVQRLQRRLQDTTGADAD